VRPKKFNPKRRKVRRVREILECRFCKESNYDKKRILIDYKDIDTLSKLLTQRGKMFSRKRSGTCAGCQRKVQTAVKHARFIGLLPYTS